MSSSCGKTCWTLQRNTECHKCRLLGPDFPWSQDTWQLVSHQCESKWHKSQKVIQEKGASWSNGRCTIYFPGEYFFWYLNDPAIEAPFLFARRQVVSPTKFWKHQGFKCGGVHAKLDTFDAFWGCLGLKNLTFLKMRLLHSSILSVDLLIRLGHSWARYPPAAANRWLEKKSWEVKHKSPTACQTFGWKVSIYIQSLSPIVNDSQHHEPTKSTRTLIFWTPRSTIV